MMLEFSEVLALQGARAVQFPAAARVRGFLIQADVSAGTSYGYVYGVDGYEDGQFIQFPTLGAGSVGGYETVVTAQGVFVILSYAEHAAERGLTQLLAHLAANPGYYATLNA
jgi:hypothetical protein